MDPLKRIVKAHWDRRADSFDAGKTHGLLSPRQTDAWQRLLTSRLGSSPRDVLDLGCGTGFLALLAAQLGHRVLGVDLAPEMIARARLKAAALALDARFLEGDVENLAAIDSASFDVIIERHLLWTLPHPLEAAREWRRLLRPAGQLLLIEGQWGIGERKDEYDAIKERLPFYGGRPAADVVGLLRDAGFPSAAVEPLMDPELWGDPPDCPRYLVRAAAPAHRTPPASNAILPP